MKYQIKAMTNENKVLNKEVKGKCLKTIDVLEETRRIDRKNRDKARRLQSQLQMKIFSSEGL